jgi:hypothetical protein
MTSSSLAILLPLDTSVSPRVSYFCTSSSLTLIKIIFQRTSPLATITYLPLVYLESCRVANMARYGNQLELQFQFQTVLSAQ